MAKKKQTYEAEQIIKLSDLEHVRTRPLVYIPDRAEAGLNHLLIEALDNAIDEIVNGEAKNIVVHLYKDNSISVEDDGRGIPIGPHPTEKDLKGKPLSALTVALTMLGAGGKFGQEGSAFKTSGGLHGMGIKATNFLSEWLVATVFRDGWEYQQVFIEGLPEGPVKKVKKVDKKKTGTIIHFKPDPKIFSITEFDVHKIIRRLRIASFLLPGAKFRFINDIDGEDLKFKSTGGLLEFCNYLNEGSTQINKPIMLATTAAEAKEIGASAKFVFSYNDEGNTDIQSYTNNVHNVEGGTHYNAAVDGLQKAIFDIAANLNLFKGIKDPKFVPTDVTEGLTMIISVLVEEPDFESQYKRKLVSPEIRNPLGDWVKDSAYNYLNKHRDQAKAIATYVTENMKARMDAKKAKAASKQRGMKKFDGKLMPCSSPNPEMCELFLVEGDSAGGTAKAARNPRTQAVLPLRGKVMNSLKASLSKVLSNTEFKSIFSALNVDVQRKRRDIEVDYTDLRYHKVNICCDADPDGGHIICLLLTFFYRHLRKIIENGYLYVAELPLFQVNMKNKTVFLRDDIALAEFISEHKNSKFTVSRLKGLGEMDAPDLAMTAFDASTRVLRKVTIEDAKEANDIFSQLMGDNPEARKNFIMRNIKFEPESE